MDNPIFTLNRPKFLDIAVSKDGRWTAILTSLGIKLYDRSGAVIGHYPARFSTNLDNYSVWEPMITIHGDELGYFTNFGMFSILSLPALEVQEVFTISKYGGGSFVHNDSWLIYTQGYRETLAIQREKQQVHEPYVKLPTTNIPEFIDEHLVFIPATANKPAFCFDLKKRQIVKEFSRPALAVSPDTRYYLVRHDENSVMVCEFETHSALGQFEVGDVFLFCEESDYLATQFSEGRYVLYDLNSGAIVADHRIAHDNPRFINLDAGTTLTQMESDNWIRQYDLLTGELLHSLAHLPGFPSHLAVSSHYLAMSNNQGVTVFDFAAGEIVWQKSATDNREDWNAYSGVNVAIHGTWVTVQSGNNVEIWDFKQNRVIASCPRYAAYPCLTSQFLYFTGLNSQDEWVLVKFDIKGQAIVHESTSYQGRLYLSKRYGLVVTLARVGSAIVLVDEHTLREKWRIEVDRNKVSIVDDFLVRETDEKIKLSSLENDQLLFELSQLYPRQYTERLNLDGTVLITTTEDYHGDMHFWRPGESLEPVYVIDTGSWIQSMVFADENTLVTSHEDGTVNFWDITHITKGLI